ncbi:phospholipase D family protein [Gordonia alkanivorans]|nr:MULTISPECIES: phospholipase D family protein [Gordonia]MDH3009265.1 phospholipase D family protein [Gordonia alkanivorans]MDH3018160.1 phospholipase D family protein [Gordonia alkanivorans]MDH3043571.1 phospholipase D family protein [Gordonia alkanivorans]MDH3048077.1 phospholipase D family protein [Gordonia alkanivorans]
MHLAVQPWKDGTSLDDWFASVGGADDEEAQIVTIVVAWAKRSGLSLIESDLRKIRARGGSISMIVGISEGGATRQGLELALALCDRVEVFFDSAGRTFHPKVYLSRSASRARIFVGSNNLTAGGVFRNYEAGLVLDTVPTDHMVTQVEEWIHLLRSDAECCVELTPETLEAVVASELYRIGDEDVRRQSAGNSAVGSTPGAVFGVSRTRKKGPRGKQGETATPAQSATAAVAISGEVVRRWSKKLKRSDAQQLGPSAGTNLTGALRLTMSGHEIDQTTYFRYEFFGLETWHADVDKPNVDYTEVPVEVFVLGDALGVMTFRVDHDVSREAGQGNFTTVLKWGPMNALLRQTSYVDNWVTLEALTSGYRLSIVADDPQTASGGPLQAGV